MACEDKITPEERALIDRALAAGNVTKVRSGVSAERFLWCGQRNAIIDDAAVDRPWGARSKKVSRKINASVAECLAAGMNRQQIQDHLGLSKSTVNRHVRGFEYRNANNE